MIGITLSSEQIRQNVIASQQLAAGGEEAPAPTPGPNAAATTNAEAPAAPRQQEAVA